LRLIIQLLFSFLTSLQKYMHRIFMVKSIFKKMESNRVNYVVNEYR